MKTLEKTKRAYMGTLSSGSMKTEDILPECIYFLKSIAKDCQITKQVKAIVAEYNKLEVNDNGDYSTDDSHEGMDSAESAEMLLNEDCFNLLNEIAPPYFYFGSHPGDGADFGFWLSDGFDMDFDGLKVSDLSEIPKGYTGEILHINDHGNMSLYYASRGRLREIWAVV